MQEAELVKKLASIRRILKIPSWYRQAVLVARFHRLCQKKYGIAIKTRGKSGWSLRDSAAALNISFPVVQECVNAMQAIRQYPELKELGSRDEVLRAYQMKGKE